MVLGFKIQCRVTNQHTLEYPTLSRTTLVLVPWVLFQEIFDPMQETEQKMRGTGVLCTQGAPSRDQGNGEQLNLVHLTGKETSGVRDLRGVVVGLPSSPLS